MDILFKNDDFVFSYRVGGILKHNGKILLQRPKNDDYAIIGGHIAAMETSMERRLQILMLLQCISSRARRKRILLYLPWMMKYLILQMIHI